jgi:hypothetical protein
MTGPFPQPSDAVVIKLAQIAVLVRSTMGSEHPVDKVPVGLRRIQNERRRAVEKILVLLADPELRDYIAQLDITETGL